MNKLMDLDIQFFSDDELPPYPEPGGTNMEIGSTEVTYTNIYSGNEVEQVRVEVRVPVKLDEQSGYMTLEGIDGWELLNDGTMLAKTYTSNTSEAIKIVFVGFEYVMLDDVYTYQAINVFEITSALHLRCEVSYVCESTENSDYISKAIVKVFIKDGSLGSYVIGKDNVTWEVSDDQTYATQEAFTNGIFMNQFSVYPAGESETISNVINDLVTWKVENTGITVGDIEIGYENVHSGDSIVGTKVTLKAPYSTGTETGYASLHKLSGDGWKTLYNDTQLTKFFSENTTETVKVQIVEVNGYRFEESKRTVQVSTDVIDYKKTV
jgi:hypothetical protein